MQALSARSPCSAARCPSTVGTGGRYVTRTLAAGDQASFPIGWVHDVVRAPAARGVRRSGGSPTLSVHAYSPPLSAMSYYEVTGHGTLRRTRTELTDHPEGDL